MSNCQSLCLHNVHLFLKYFMCILILIINNTNPSCQLVTMTPTQETGTPGTHHSVGCFVLFWFFFGGVGIFPFGLSVS